MKLVAPNDPPLMLSPERLKSSSNLAETFRRLQEAVNKVGLAVNNNIGESGTTGNRPTKDLTVGQAYFDLTLGKPVWIKSLGPTVWVDATGGVV